MIPRTILEQNKVPEILERLRTNWQGDESELQRKLHAYYLSCARAIWRLLPQEESRIGIEVGELYLEGRVTEIELSHENYYTEGAAFNILYDCDPAAITKWIEETEAIPKE